MYHSNMCGLLYIFLALLFIYWHAVFQWTSSDSENEQPGQRASTPSNGNAEEEEVYPDLTYGRLYNDTTIHLSKENRFSIYLGVKPELKKKKAFQREMLICDSATGSSISLNMFQFVRMLANFKSLLWSAEKFAEYSNSDERYAFTVGEINSLKVETMGIAVSGQPPRYKINIYGQRDKYILFDEISLLTLIDSERAIVKLYRALAPNTVEDRFNHFVRDCVLLCKDKSAEEAKNLVTTMAYEAKGTFAIETVLKFWDFLYHCMQREAFVQFVFNI